MLHFWGYIPNSESVGLQSLGPGTGDTKMHAPKNRNSPGIEPGTFRCWVAKLGQWGYHGDIAPKGSKMIFYTIKNNLRIHFLTDL